MSLIQSESESAAHQVASQCQSCVHVSSVLWVQKMCKMKHSKLDCCFKQQCMALGET